MKTLNMIYYTCCCCESETMKQNSKSRQSSKAVKTIQLLTKWEYFPTSQLIIESCYYGNGRTHLTGGAPTPADWRSHGRLPSWCCGSAPSPPPCWLRTGRRWGCSWKPPAGPALGGGRWRGEDGRTKRKEKKNIQVRRAERRWRRTDMNASLCSGLWVFFKNHVSTLQVLQNTQFYTGLFLTS